MRGGAALAIAPEPRRILHAGCGDAPLPVEVFGENVVETRLDLDPKCRPDVVRELIDLSGLGPFDAVYCAHALEHLTLPDARTALRQFYAVLRPGGIALVAVPDLEGVEPTEDVLFVSPGGPISGLDLIYGHQASLATNPYMAHRCGFVLRTLTDALIAAGFADAEVKRGATYNLIGIGTK